jgi:hypothetical protein
MKRLIFILSTVTMMLSCEETENESKYPEIYYTETVTEIGYRIFTGDGEIKNEEIKNSLISKSESVLPSYTTIRQEEDICATILNEDQLFFEKGSAISDTLSIETQNSLTYWEENKITTYYPSLHNEFDKTTNFTDTSFLCYIPLVYDETIAPSTTGYSKRIEQKTCFYIEKDADELIIPFVDYCLLTDFGYQTPLPEFITYPGINNRLKDNPHFTLAQKDTLIIREYVQRLTKESIPNQKKSLELTIYNANSWTSNSSTLSSILGVSVKLFATDGSNSIAGQKEAYKEISDENGIVDFYDIEAGNYLLIATKDDLSNLKNGLVINGVFMNAQDTIYTSDVPYQENVEIGGLKYKDMNKDGIINNLDLVEGDYVQIERSKLLKKDIYIGK